MPRSSFEHNGSVEGTAVATEAARVESEELGSFKRSSIYDQLRAQEDEMQVLRSQLAAARLEGERLKSLATLEVAAMPADEPALPDDAPTTADLVALVTSAQESEPITHAASPPTEDAEPDPEAPVVAPSAACVAQDAIHHIPGVSLTPAPPELAVSEDLGVRSAAELFGPPPPPVSPRAQSATIEPPVRHAQQPQSIAQVEQPPADIPRPKPAQFVAYTPVGDAPQPVAIESPPPPPVHEAPSQQLATAATPLVFPKHVPSSVKRESPQPMPSPAMAPAAFPVRAALPMRRILKSNKPDPFAGGVGLSAASSFFQHAVPHGHFGGVGEPAQLFEESFQQHDQAEPPLSPVEVAAVQPPTSPVNALPVEQPPTSPVNMLPATQPLGAHVELVAQPRASSSHHLLPRPRLGPAVESTPSTAASAASLPRPRPTAPETRQTCGPQSPTRAPTNRRGSATVIPLPLPPATVPAKPQVYSPAAPVVTWSPVAMTLPPPPTQLAPPVLQPPPKTVHITVPANLLGDDFDATVFSHTTPETLDAQTHHGPPEALL